MNKNLKDIESKITNSLPEIEKLGSDLELFSAQQSQVKLLERTFSGNKGVSDIHGTPLTKYSAAYAAKRIKAGLQVDKKDLIFNKNSSSIFNSLDVGASQGKPAFGFSTQKGAQIAGYQEKQNNTKIFQMNDKERADVMEEARIFVFDRLKKITSTWH